MAAHKDCQLKDYDQLFEDILNDIVEKNWSASKALVGRMSFSKFYDMLEEDVNRAKKYTRACILRAERINDEIMEIADTSDNDTITAHRADGSEYQRPNMEYINRSRLRVDARKWWLSKTNPKKFGDRIDVTTGNESINNAQAISLSIAGKPIDLSLDAKESKE